MNVVKYLDEHGLETLAKILSFGRRKIWHGTREEWDALDEDERKKYDQAEIEEVEGSAGNGAVYVVDKAEAGNMNPITSNAVANMNVDIDVTDNIESGNMDPITSNAVSKLKATVDTNTSNIATNKANIATNTSNISSLTTKVNTNTTNISSLTTKVNTNTTNITTAQTTANTAKTTADTAKSTADTAKSTADTAKSTADTAKSIADKNKTDIASLDTRLSKIEQYPVISVTYVTKELTVTNNNENYLPLSTVNNSTWRGLELKHSNGTYDYIGNLEIEWNIAQGSSTSEWLSTGSSYKSYNLGELPSTGSKYCGYSTSMNMHYPTNPSSVSECWGNFITQIVTTSTGTNNSATGRYLRLVAYYMVKRDIMLQIDSSPTPLYIVGCTSRW